MMRNSGASKQKQSGNHILNRRGRPTQTTKLTGGSDDYIHNLKRSLPEPDISDPFSSKEITLLENDLVRRTQILATAQRQTTGTILLARATNEIDDFLDSLPLPPQQPDPPADPVLVDPGTPQYSDISVCSTAKYRAGKTAIDLAALAPNSDTLWPGSVVAGHSIEGGILSPINLPRGRGEITMINPAAQPGDGASMTVSLKEPSLKSTADAAQALRAKYFKGGIPAFAGETVISTYHSIDEAAMHLDASVSWMSGSIRNVLDISSSDKRTNVVISIVQAYYDLTFSAPDTPSSVFKNALFGGVTLRDLKDAVGPHALKPAYVSTIRFGRMILLRASSDASESELKDALHLAVSGVTTSGQLDATLKTNHAVAQTEFAMVVLGSQDGTAVLIGGFAGLQHIADVWSSGAKLAADQPAFPISYQLRWLGRNPSTGERNESAKLTFTSDYSAVSCSPQKITRFGVRFNTTDDDKDGGDRVDVDLFNGGEQVSTYWCDQPYNHKWDDHTSQPDGSDADFGGVAGWYSTTVFTRTVYTNEISALKLRVRKTGDKGWHFQVSSQLWLEGGRRIEFVTFGREVKFKGSNQFEMFP
jgi:Thiol-activated cytolysin